jgi:AraC-like DNA-binding protein
MPNPHPRPWHRGSVFGVGPRRPLDRERRARYRYLLNAHRRARRLTPLTELIGDALVRRLGVDGQLDPSHDTIAEDVGCSSRTVRRALAALRALGLLMWQCRLVRDGWRTAQTSNAQRDCDDGEVGEAAYSEAAK